MLWIKGMAVINCMQHWFGFGSGSTRGVRIASCWSDDELITRIGVHDRRLICNRTSVWSSNTILVTKPPVNCPAGRAKFLFFRRLTRLNPQQLQYNSHVFFFSRSDFKVNQLDAKLLYNSAEIVFSATRMGIAGENNFYRDISKKFFAWAVRILRTAAPHTVESVSE